MRLEMCGAGSGAVMEGRRWNAGIDKSEIDGFFDGSGI
jgi:hypothetical protein